MDSKSESREKLLNRIKKKNLLWSYSRNVTAKEISDGVIMDTVLRYGDSTDLKMLFECFEREDIYELWVRQLLPDNRFKKLNFYLARVVFDVNWEGITREKGKWSRLEKFKFLASEHSKSI